MPEGVYITKSDFNQLMKDIAYLKEYVQNSLKVAGKSKWVKPAEAMELIGCKEGKLKKMRLAGTLDWRYFGTGRGVMILRSSIERYNMSKSTVFEHA